MRRDFTLREVLFPLFLLALFAGACAGIVLGI
jgi:hypothetical protein